MHKPGDLPFFERIFTLRKIRESYGNFFDCGFIDEPFNWYGAALFMRAAFCCLSEVRCGRLPLSKAGEEVI